MDADSALEGVVVVEPGAKVVRSRVVGPGDRRRERARRGRRGRPERRARRRRCVVIGSAVSGLDRDGGLEDRGRADRDRLGPRVAAPRSGTRAPAECTGSWSGTRAWSRSTDGVRIALDARPALDPRRTGVGHYAAADHPLPPASSTRCPSTSRGTSTREGLFSRARVLRDVGAPNLTEHASRFPARVFQPVSWRLRVPRLEWLGGAVRRPARDELRPAADRVAAAWCSWCTTSRTRDARRPRRSMTAVAATVRASALRSARPA